MADTGAKTAAGKELTEVYRVSIQAICTNATKAGRLIGAALKEVDGEVLDLQQHVVCDTAHPAVSKK